MDDDTDSANWVLVDENDCVEEAINMNPPVTSVPATPDSDQESDGSISIISDHPTDSYSEEETEMSKKSNDTTKIMPIIKIDTEFETDINEDDIEIQDQRSESVELLETNMAQNIQDEFINHQTSDDEGSSTSEPSGKQWTFADEKSKLDLKTPKKTFFLDCSQEPILEISANDTDVDTESTNSSQECQALVKKEDTSITHISNRDPAREREVYINRISIGFLISMLILTSSHLIRQYLDYNEDGLHPSLSTTFLDSIADNEKARPIINFCVDRQKAKGNEYSEHAVEKCVVKRLRKKNREDAMKKTEIYLQMKERVLELREKELAEKEREILKKWRKRIYKTEDVDKERNKRKYDKKLKVDKDQSSKEFNQKIKKNLDHKEGKSCENHEGVSAGKEQKTWTSDKTKGKIKTFRKRGSWVFEKVKESTNWNHKMHSEDDFSNNKKLKKASTDKEETLKRLKNNIKDSQKDIPKQKFKELKGDKREDPNEEWYIKYNPVKNTIKLINITTLPEQDFRLIKNGNKTINGQWYFSLYGSGRTNIRNKEKAAEWYFRRGNFREHKRDKAKWYFDYMSARDNTRYFY